MLDFSSSLYLGLRHGSPSLRGWSSLSSGRPAALVEPDGAGEVAQDLATLIGCERGTLLPSTLHAFWDLFAMLADEGATIHVDAGAYPIACWGIERAAARGARVVRFAHHDLEALRRHVGREARGGARPIVVTDGFCPGCGRPAPLRDYLDVVRPLGGLLVVDDTQALGILGRRAGAAAPYGQGGGGTLRFTGAGGEATVVVSSLAKGFGAPVAVLAAGDGFVGRFEDRSETRSHCSPPSVAAVRAAEHALLVNLTRGDALRDHLAELVLRFRRGLAEIGLRAFGRLFPVQTLAPAPGCDAARLHARLLGAGVRAVLHRDRAGHATRLSVLVTAQHTCGDIDQALAAIGGAAGRRSRQPSATTISQSRGDRP